MTPTRRFAPTSPLQGEVTEEFREGVYRTRSH
jgi:hypothetical protein